MALKVLITGCSGYIGSHLIQLLQKNKDYIIYGLDKDLPKIKIDNFFHLNLLSNQLDDLCSIEFDTIIHLAAEVKVGEGEKSPVLYYLTNIFATEQILDKLKTKNFVFSSTGNAENCLNVYGRSKKAAEDIVKELCVQKNIKFTIFRFYNVIGTDGFTPTNPDGIFYNLIKAIDTGQFNIYGSNYATKDGTCIRDYLHVNEVCYSLEKALKENSNKIDNLGHGVGYTVLEITNLFQKVNNTKFNINFKDPRPGDLVKTVLEEPSPYMTYLYNIEQLLCLAQHTTE